MLDWLFSRSCPVDSAAKRWIEQRLIWLFDEFGTNELYPDNTVLPMLEYFPDCFDGSWEGVQALFKRVCGFMGVDPSVIRLDFFRLESNEQLLINEYGERINTVAAGEYHPGLILLNVEEFADPVSLIGTLAHELAHERLLGEGRISQEMYDHELLTDLTVCFKGMGLFLANRPRYYASLDTNWPGTVLRKPEYMTTPMFGYALGLLAWLRGNQNPPWLKHLAFGVRGEFKQTIKFLNTAGNAPMSLIRRR